MVSTAADMYIEVFYVNKGRRFLCLVPNAKGQSKGAGLGH